jgi:hypothetical protein
VRVGERQQDLRYNWTMARTLKQTYDTIQSLTSVDLLKVYKGKPGCACGCLGKYRTSKVNRQEADVERGYKHGNDEVNDAYVTRILRKVQYLSGLMMEGVHNLCWDVNDEMCYISVTQDDNKVFTLFLTKAAQEKFAGL